MPRLDIRTKATPLALAYEPQLVLQVLIEQLNILRGDLGLPPITAEHMQQLILDYQRAHPRPTQA